MSEGLNQVLLLGNIGSLELKTSQAGMAILRISLATNERIKIGEEWKDKTTWHRVTVFGKRAEGLHRFLQVGDRLFVDGKISVDNWTDKEGKKRESVSIIAERVIPTGGKARPESEPSSEEKPPF